MVRRGSAVRVRQRASPQHQETRRIRYGRGPVTGASQRAGSDFDPFDLPHPSDRTSYQRSAIRGFHGFRRRTHRRFEISRRTRAADFRRLLPGCSVRRFVRIGKCAYVVLLSGRRSRPQGGVSHESGFRPPSPFGARLPAGFARIAGTGFSAHSEQTGSQVCSSAQRPTDVLQAAPARNPNDAANMIATMSAAAHHNMISPWPQYELRA
jgi:hypothetical protein